VCRRAVSRASACRSTRRHDPLDVVRRTGAPHRQQPLLRLRRRHTGQRADLGVRELAACERRGEPWQRCQGTRDSYPLPRCANVEPHPPAQPGGAGAESGVPALSGVELADEIEEARGRGVEVRRQLGDLVAQSVQRERLHEESPPSAGATLHPSFGAPREGRQPAIAARSTFLATRRTAAQLWSSVGRWVDIHRVLPPRGDCPRKSLSSGKSRVEPGRSSRRLSTFRYADRHRASQRH